MTQINPEALNVASQMILKEIDLRGTDAERKTKLDQFEMDWKALTGANDMQGARFVGKLDINRVFVGCILAYNSRGFFEGISLFNEEDYQNFKVTINIETGALIITPLFSHLESVEILIDDSPESRNKNLNNLNAYKSNLELLGVDTSIGFQVPIRVGMAGEYCFAEVQVFTQDTFLTIILWLLVRVRYHIREFS